MNRLLMKVTEYFCNNKKLNSEYIEYNSRGLEVYTKKKTDSEAIIRIYDDNDRLIKRTCNGEILEERIYNKRGDILKTITQDTINKYSYNLRGLLAKQTVKYIESGSKYSIIFKYDKDDRLLYTKNSVSGFESTYLYLNDGQTIIEETSDSRETTGFDNNGNMVYYKNEQLSLDKRYIITHEASYTYNEDNNIIHYIDNKGREERRKYVGETLLSIETNEVDYLKNTLDKDNMIIKTETPGMIEEFEYNEYGDIILYKNSEGYVTKTSYCYSM